MSYDIVGFQDYTDFIILLHHKDNTIYLITKFILIFFKKKGAGGFEYDRREFGSGETNKKPPIKGSINVSYFSG